MGSIGISEVGAAQTVQAGDGEIDSQWPMEDPEATSNTAQEGQSQHPFNSGPISQHNSTSKQGLLYQNSWQLGENISVRYAIRYRKTEVHPNRVDHGDVFIDLEDCRNLLTIYQDGNSLFEESLLSSVWSVNVLNRELKFCPLTEFVYQAAVISGGTLTSQVFRGIINLLILNLVPEAQPRLVEFKEIEKCDPAIVEKSRRPKKKGGRKRKPSQSGEPILCKQSDFHSTSSRLDCDRVKSEGEKVSQLHSDEKDVDVKNEPKFAPDSLDYYSSEDEIPKKRNKDNIPRISPLNADCDKSSNEYHCSLCTSSFKKESFLYIHQLNKHPDVPHQHIPKPSSLCKKGAKWSTECRVCGIILRGPTKEYKHYLENHPDYSDKPEKPEYLINKEIEQETGEKPRKRDVEATCKVCKKEFATIKHLYNHCRREHPDRPDACPLEPVRLGPICTLHERLASHGPSADKFQCGLEGCTLLFDRFLSLVDHERSGHPEAFLCILCGLACGSADALIAHSDAHHGNKCTYICRICGFFNRNSRGLTVHTQQEHMKGTLTYQCEKCPYTSGNYVTFGNHKRTAHREENSKFVCEECGNHFATKQSLTSHRRLHNPDFKKFQCKYCPQKFGHSSVLLIHMRVHTGEKPFSCNICGATFGSQTASIRHRRVVHANDSDMTFQCGDCGKKYPSRAKRDFENHCKTHTGVRDHVCELCGSAYFSKKGLRKHERAVHPEQKPMKPKPFKIGEENGVGPDLDPDAIPDDATVTQLEAHHRQQHQLPQVQQAPPISSHFVTDDIDSGVTDRRRLQDTEFVRHLPTDVHHDLNRADLAAHASLFGGAVYGGSERRMEHIHLLATTSTMLDRSENHLLGSVAVNESTGRQPQAQHSGLVSAVAVASSQRENHLLSLTDGEPISSPPGPGRVGAGDLNNLQMAYAAAALNNSRHPDSTRQSTNQLFAPLRNAN